MTPGIDNTATWERVSTPPPSALKKISGGRLTGMTDIKPAWRMQVLTEVFGPVGDGWRYTIDKLWTEPGDNKQVAAFALVTLQVRYPGGDDWSDPIPGIGGSMLIVNEKRGPYTNDECYKMAVTDALSVAMKAVGVGAEVYMGNWDGSKYLNGEKPEAGGVTGSQLNDLKKRWLAANPILNGQSKEIIIPMFTKWVSQSVGREFDPTRTEQWTTVDLRSCMALVDGSQRKQTAAAELCSEGDEDYADPKTGEIHRWAIGISAEMKAATNLDAIMAVVNRRAPMCTDVDQKAALDKVAEQRINEIAVSEKKGDN